MFQFLPYETFFKEIRGFLALGIAGIEYIQLGFAQRNEFGFPPYSENESFPGLQKAGE